jgi:light-dependent protochlorophyllide reductase
VDTKSQKARGREKFGMNNVVITGGNRGLGLECARVLAQAHDWRVIVACRDPQQAESALANLRRESNHSMIEAWELDLASLDSVNKFADKIQTSTLHLQALVCNAGTQIVSETQYTRDGFEMTFGVNHLGHFLLANRLLDCLDSSARIIFVSSDTHDPAQKTGMPEPQYTNARLLAFPPQVQEADLTTVGRRRYTTSKLANVFTTYELARRLKQQRRKITVNVFNPGLMPGTGLARDYSPLLRFAWNYVLPLLDRIRFGSNRVQNSGAALAYLITAPELEHTSGKYFSGKQMLLSSQESYDLAKANELWKTSAKLVGLDRRTNDAVSVNQRIP